MDGLYLVTDRHLCGPRGVAAVVAAAAGAGLSAVQLREKHAGTRDIMETARALIAVLRPRSVPLIINDRVDVALAVGADGVHLGQADMPVDAARRLLGGAAIIGLSVETWDDVTAAQAQDVSYLGISPVFKTPTKTDTRGAWGLDGVARIRAFSRHRLVAIGGIGAGNAADVMAAGADAVAVVSAVCAAAEPARAVQDLNQAIAEGLSRRRRLP